MNEKVQEEECLDCDCVGNKIIKLMQEHIYGPWEAIRLLAMLLHSMPLKSVEGERVDMLEERRVKLYEFTHSFFAFCRAQDDLMESEGGDATQDDLMDSEEIGDVNSDA
jgi:hypothetical protein